MPILCHFDWGPRRLLFADEGRKETEASTRIVREKIRRCVAARR